LIFGFAIRLEAKDIPLVVQDFDRTNMSNRYMESIYATNQFKPVAWDINASPQLALDRSLAKAVVIIPPDFTRQLRSAKQAEIQVLVDGTDANNARIIKNGIKAITNSFMRAQGLIASKNSITTQTRLWFNPGRKESLSIVPGTFAVVLWIFPSLLAAIAMVREKEKGTILQLYASSLSSTELIWGKALAYWVVALGMAWLVMGGGAVIFGLQFVGDPSPFLLGTVVYLWASTMFGLMIGARANDQNAAVQAVSLVGFLTSFLLSGFIYPLSNIPFPLSLIPNVVPARYFIEITRDAFVRGVGWSGVWLSLVLIFLLGMMFFNVARKALSRMQLNS
jgi:ABC-2 type transport system permease protein